MNAEPELRRALLRWQSPSFGSVLPMDIGVVLPIVLILAAVHLSTGRDAIFRAKLTEALYAAGAARNAVIERYALTGDAFEATGAVTAVELPNAAAHLSGAAGTVARAKPAKAPAAADAADAAGAEGATDRIKAAQQANQELARLRESGEANARSKYVSALRIEGAAIVVSGRIAGSMDPGGAGSPDYELALVPAVLEGTVPQVVVWQCGRNRLPDGWTGPTPALAHRLTDHLLPQPCRDRPRTP